MSKYFLITCITLMIASGFYGATDMTRDLKNGELIDYENVDYRHAKAILFIVKTTGIGTHKYIGLDKDAKETTRIIEQKEPEAKGKSQVEEYFESFSRGDCKRC